MLFQQSSLPLYMQINKQFRQIDRVMSYLRITSGLITLKNKIFAMPTRLLVVPKIALKLNNSLDPCPITLCLFNVAR